MNTARKLDSKRIVSIADQNELVSKVTKIALASTAETQANHIDKMQLALLLAILVGVVACGTATLYMKASGWFVLPIVIAIAGVFQHRQRRSEDLRTRAVTYKSLNPKRY